MQVKQKKAKRKGASRGLSLLSAFLFAVLVFLLMALEHNLRPAAKTVASMKSREVSVNVMQLAVRTLLEEQPRLLDGLFAVRQDSAGHVTGAVCDPASLARIQNTLEGAVSESLQSSPLLKFSVPAGTLSGMQLLAGLGPGIPVQAVPLSAVQSRVETQLTSGGINQTVLEVDVVVSVEMGTLLAGSRMQETVESRIRAAQLMVVGDVPQFYNRK